MKIGRWLFSVAMSLSVLSGTLIAHSGEALVRPPAFDWDTWQPPKYVPNWKGVPHELRLPPVDLTDPPAEPVHWTAQWEEREGCLIAWPLGWTSTYTAFCEIVDELQEVGVVYMLYSSLASKSAISGILASGGVSQDYCEWLNIPYNDNWTRDWGPQNIWGLESGNWGIVDNRCLYGPASNNVNPALNEMWRMDYYESPILTEGGNLCTDGMGRVFCTRWCLLEASLVGMSEEELREAYWDYLNVELTILPWPPISPHLDMSAKLVDPETWIIGEWPPDDPNTPDINNMIAILDTMTASTGNPYTIYRVQQPDRLPSGYWRTYTNSYMQNGKVLLAVYGVEQDSAAIAVFQQVLPGYEIVPINCAGFDGSGGAIHCSTHGIADHIEDYFHDVEITATPVSPPIIIPSGGGDFQYDITLDNLETDSIYTQVWVEVTLPDGSVLSPLYEEYWDLPGNSTASQSLSQYVPERAPSGDYTYSLFTGERLPRVVNDSSYFEFTKIGVDGAVSNDLTGWWTEEIITSEAAVATVNPADFAIVGVYPNPFNPTAVLSYKLQDASIVNLSVYDISGRKVAELVNGWRDTGVHEVTFDGVGFSSGIYFYRLDAGGQSASGKMVLVK